MRLYYKPGACSLASRIVLIELGLDFNAVKVDTDAGLTEHGQDFRAVNPRGYVPALELETGEVITENPAVLQYLGDLAPGGLTPPTGTLERVRLQEALNFISSELHKAFSPFFHGEARGDRVEPARAALARRIGDVDAMLADGRPFLLGARASVADIYLFVVLNWAGFIAFDLTPWPSVSAFMDRMIARPAVRIALQQEGFGRTEA